MGIWRLNFSIACLVSANLLLILCRRMSQCLFQLRPPTELADVARAPRINPIPGFPSCSAIPPELITNDARP